MTLSFGRIATALAGLIIALPLLAQTGPHGTAEDALARLEMRVDDIGREFRAVAPHGRDRFLAASFTLEGQTTSAALNLVSEDGRIGPPIPLPKPLNYPGSRIDGLLPVGDAIIAIGHLAGGPDDRRGWILRIEPDLSISAQTVLPVAANTQSINYYYGGVLDEQGRLIVAGRADQPDFPGIGVRFNLLGNGLFQIAMAYPGGPAGDAGIRQGDVLLRANGRDLRGLDSQQTLAQLTGTIDETLQLTIDRPGVGQREFTLRRSMVKGVTAGVVAVLDPVTLDVVQGPKLVVHSTSRAGLQDVGRMRDGRIVGVGWWESFAPDGSTFDKAWIVGLDGNLDPQSDQQFGRDGASSIAQHLHHRSDGRTIVVGSMNSGAETVAFASELSFDGAGRAPAQLTPLREHFEGPGRGDVFRGITTLSNGSTIVGGAFRSNDDPRYRALAMLLGSDAAPRALFEGCAQAYVWDMASTGSDAIAVAGYCIDEAGIRRAALMWSPPMEIADDAVALSSAPRLQFDASSNGQSFDLSQPESVLIFAPAGTPGVLSLTDAAGQLVDYAGVDAGKAGLLEADLSPGRYEVQWTSDGTGPTPRIDVLKAGLAMPEPGLDGRYALAPEVEMALSLLGYDAVTQERHAPPGTQSMAMTRDIAAFQLSRNLPASGSVDIVTEVALSVDGALQAASRGQERAELASRLSQAAGPETLPSRFGPVAGHWRGDAFVGRATLNSLDYAGDWELTETGQVQPSGFGRLENRTSREAFTGSFRDGVFAGLGVSETARDVVTRHVGIFDELGRFTKGARFEAGRVVASGIFAPGAGTLLRDVALAR